MASREMMRATTPTMAPAMAPADEACRTAAIIVISGSVLEERGELGPEGTLEIVVGGADDTEAL